MSYQLITFSDTKRKTTYIYGDEKNLVKNLRVHSIDELFNILDTVKEPMVCCSHNGEHDVICDKLTKLGFVNIDHCDDSAECFLYGSKLQDTISEDTETKEN